MAAGANHELVEFQQFVTRQVETGSAASPEEALDLWRVDHPLDDFDETVAALRESLADWEAGDRGLDWREFDRQFRAAHDLPRQP